MRPIGIPLIFPPINNSAIKEGTRYISNTLMHLTDDNNFRIFSQQTK